MAIEPVSVRVHRPWPGTRKGQELRMHKIRAARLVAAGLVELIEPPTTAPVNARPRKSPRRATPAASGEPGALFDTED